TVASIELPALFSSTAGVLTESRFQASATAPPSPSSSAGQVGLRHANFGDAIGEGEGGRVDHCGSIGARVSEPMLTTVSEPATPAGTELRSLPLHWRS